MAKDKKKKISLSSCKGKRVEAQFTDDTVTNDGGVVLLREVDQQLNLSMQIAQAIPEYRDVSRIEHSREAIINQRIIGLALGYDDLRHDPAIQTAADKLTPLASSPTLCRLENKATREICVDMHKILIEQFIASYDSEQPQDSYWQGFCNELQDVKINFKNCALTVGRHIEQIFLSQEMIANWLPKVIELIARVRQKIKPGRHYPRRSYKPTKKWTNNVKGVANSA